MVFDPFKNLGVLVSGIVVDDHMHRLLLGHLGINDVEEADELLMAMALHTLADDLAFQHIKRCEQRRDAMTLVVVCDGAGTSLLSSSAAPAGCGPAPGFGFSHRPRERWRGWAG